MTNSSSETLRFPYMFWAHTEACRSSYCFSQSGMPAPDAGILGQAPPIDISPPTVTALPAVQSRLAELFDTSAENILVTAGASAAMHTLAQRYFRPGSIVVTESPSYEPFRALPSLMGAEVRVVERKVEDDFRLDLDAIERALEGCGPDRPGHLFLSNPNNPTGQSYGPEEITRLSRAAERAGGLLISNEIYMEFAQPSERIHAFKLAPNAISIGGLTKAYGLGALRLGWLILGDGLSHEHIQLTDHTYLNYVDLPTPALVVAKLALENLESLLQPLRQFESVCRPHFVRWLAETPGIQAPPPKFGLSAFPRIEGISDTRALCSHLAEKWSVDAVPGEAFGQPGHLRIGYGLPEATLLEGLERLERGISEFRDGH